MSSPIHRYLLSRLVGDAFVDVLDPEWFIKLVGVEVERDTIEREFSFNSVDVRMNWQRGFVVVSDALEADREFRIELGELLAIFDTLNALSDSVRERVDIDFAQCRAEAYSSLGQIHPYDVQRLSSAALICACADIEQLQKAVEQSHLDWRDLLVWAGLERSTWRQDLERVWPAS